MWLFRWTASDSASLHKEGGTFLHDKVLSALLLNPLKDVSSLFNCLSGPGADDDDGSQSAKWKSDMNHAWAVFMYALPAVVFALHLCACVVFSAPVSSRRCIHEPRLRVLSLPCLVPIPHRYLSVSFGLATAFAWKYQNHPMRGDHVLFPSWTVRGVTFEQWPFGALTVCVAFCLVFYLTFMFVAWLPLRVLCCVLPTWLSCCACATPTPFTRLLGAATPTPTTGTS